MCEGREILQLYCTGTRGGDSLYNGISGNVSLALSACHNSDGTPVLNPIKGYDQRA
jgi:hypothetical protein